MAEHVFGIAPCSLCYYQRYLMVGIAALSLGIVISGYDKKFFTMLLVIVAFSGVLLTVFHIGVEQKWWAMPASCIGKIDLPSSDPKQMLAALQAQMKRQKIASCDQITWRILGIPASWLTCLAFFSATSLMMGREWLTRKK